MRFQSILLFLSIILMKPIVLIRIDSRTNPIEQPYCEDVCTDGSKCLTDEWFVCKWKQMLDPKVICCVNRKTVDTNSDRPRSAAIHWQTNCHNTQRHHLVRRSFYSFFSGFFSSPGNQTQEYWPWIASIMIFGRHHCGGSVISEYVVLTAAHCFVPLFHSSVYRLKVGFNEQKEAQEVSISRIIKHELYFQSESYHDIALLITRTPILLNSRLNILCLPTPDLRIEHLYGRNGFAIGFIHQRNGHLFKSFKTIQTKVIPRKVCSDVYAMGNKKNIPIGIQTNMVCANSIGSDDMTVGDSGIRINSTTILVSICLIGGPLVWSINRIYYLIGIVSFGRKTNALNHPSVYTNVIYYRQWILNKLRTL